MKVKIILAVLSLCLSSSSFAVIQNAELSPDIQKLVASGQLRVAMFHDDIPPFIFRDKQGNLTGFDVMMVKDIALNLGIKLVIDRQASTFDGVVQRVALGYDDIALGDLAATLPRAMSANFTQYYFQIPQVLIMSKETVKKNQGELHFGQAVISRVPVTVAALEQSSYMAYSTLAFPNGIIMSYPTLKEGVNLLQSGKASILVTDLLYARNVVSKQINPGNVVIQTIPNRYESVGIAVNASMPNLLNWLNVYLNNVDTRANMQRWKQQFGLPALTPSMPN